MCGPRPSDPASGPSSNSSIHQNPAAVLLIESDPGVAAEVAAFLASHEFSVAKCFSAREGCDLFKRRRFGALIRSARLADGDSFTPCRHLRRQSDAGILILTAEGDELDRIVGLESGADDCIATPLVPRELLARLRNIMRRRAVAAVREPLLEFGSLSIDRRRRVVRLDGVEKSMSSYLFALLVVFAENAGRVVGREEVLDLLKDQSVSNCGRSMDVQVCRLRSLIEDVAASPRRLVTIRSVGYLFKSEVNPSP